MFDLSTTDPSWHTALNTALSAMSPAYLASLETDAYLPAKAQLFNAFSLPKSQTKYILFGETPYPRSASANGYAFWDQAVTALWSDTGLSKPVNRATSLRNMMKMLLVSEGHLQPEGISQDAIAQLDKTSLISTQSELFQQLLQHGFLLLNASLVLRDKKKTLDARNWLPFVDSILESLFEENPSIQLVLLGKIAERINQLPIAKKYDKLVAEHPYNISFIGNQQVLEFFRPFHLLRQNGSRGQATG